MSATPAPTDTEALLRQDAALFRARCAEERGDDSLLLPRFSLDDWCALLAQARPQRLARGDVLMRTGQAQGSLYLLAEGALDVRVGSSGAFGHIHHERPGAVIGEVSFFDGGPRSATVWATEPSRLLELDKPAVLGFAAARPERGQDLLMALARVLARRVRRSDERRAETL